MTTLSDLSRRIIHHRERLGLTREQVAERAEMAPGYLQYLEEHPAPPTAEALSRLAKALETTTDDLLGGGYDRPPGQGPARANPHVVELDREECLSLLSPGGVGRVAFSGRRGPTVLPVNYKLHDGAVVFRTKYGGTIDEELRTGLEGVDVVIGFEVDRIDEAQRTGWSVLVQGPAHLLPPGEADSDVSAWAGGERDLYVRVQLHRVTGRRIIAL